MRSVIRLPPTDLSFSIMVDIFRDRNCIFNYIIMLYFFLNYFSVSYSPFLKNVIRDFVAGLIFYPCLCLLDQGENVAHVIDLLGKFSYLVSKIPDFMIRC